MKPWAKTMAVAAAGVVLVVVVGLLLPTAYTVKRSIVIEADPEDVHEFVGELRKWDLWGPWKDEDPTLVVTLGEKTSGIGASQSWVGKDGGGSLRITGSYERRGIEYDLILNDGAYRCRSTIRYRPADYETTVLWILKGDMQTPVVGGYLALAMDGMVGRMFERGLGNLKKVVEDYVASQD